MKTSNQLKYEPVWDKAHSTFVREIFLKNGTRLTGYSKRVGRNERRDKIDLLTNWMLRDLKNGYLDKSTTNPKITALDHIEYFFTTEGSPEPIVNLYYEFPEWTNMRSLENKKLVKFINRFYELIRKGKNPSEISNELEIRTRATNQNLLDVTLRRFSNMIDLNAYVLRLKNESDFPSGAIDHFYIKYKETHFKL